MHRGASIFLFSSYSYVVTWGWRVVDLLPHFARVLAYRCTLGKLGSSPMIDHSVYFRYPTRVFIGDRVSINRGCQFYPSGMIDAGTITLGDRVTLSPNVHFYAAGHDYTTFELEDPLRQSSSKAMSGSVLTASYLPASR